MICTLFRKAGIWDLPVRYPAIIIKKQKYPTQGNGTLVSFEVLPMEPHTLFQHPFHFAKQSAKYSCRIAIIAFSLILSTVWNLITGSQIVAVGGLTGRLQPGIVMKKLPVNTYPQLQPFSCYGIPHVVKNFNVFFFSLAVLPTVGGQQRTSMYYSLFIVWLKGVYLWCTTPS